MIYELKSDSSARNVIYEVRSGSTGETEDITRHGYYEIYYLTRGSGLYLVGNDSYDIDEGDILLIPEGVSHRTLEADEYQERQVLICRPQYIPHSVNEAIGDTATVIRSPISRGEIDEMFSRIAREYSAQDVFCDDALRCIIGELMIMLSRCNNLYVKNENNSPAVATAISYIKEHYSDRISLTDVANVCKVSSPYLSRRFKDEVGVGFSDYLSRLRLRNAARMLSELPEVSVTEVAFACGFNDSNYFSDKFKKQYGVSPLKFKSD